MFALEAVRGLCAMSKNNYVGKLSLSTTIVTRFLSLCAVLLALPTIAAAQPTPLAPGWTATADPRQFPRTTRD
jgi:hypothetical protein